MGTGKQLKALLMIEGRSIPFEGASTNFQAGQPATASIQMVPLREISSVLPRTMVHLFIKDFNYVGKNKPWILAFEGEVYGFSAGKNSSSRTFTLLCMDVSNYWDNAKQAYMNTKTASGSVTNTLAGAAADSEARATNMVMKKGVGSLTAYLVRIINKKLKGPRGPEAFLDGVIDILKGVEDINPFFKYNSLRYRLPDRIAFKSSGNLSEIFDLTNKSKFLESVVGSGGGGVRTIRQVIGYLMGLVFHNFVSVPFPSKVKAATGMKNGIGAKKDKTIGSFVFKPDSYMLPPPRCNVIYPDQYDNFGYTRNFFHEVSRIDFRPAPLSADLLDGLGNPRIYQKAFFAPSGYSKYSGTRDAEHTENSTVDDKIFANSGGSGEEGKKIEDLKTSPVLKDFHFLSYEEVLKGIFGDQGNMMPSARMICKTTDLGGQNKFFQRATDFMFFKKRYASRITRMSGPLNFAPVPGFSVLILDNSEAEQHVVGNLEGISHSFSATGGGSTSYDVSYSRLVEEKDFWNDEASEPPIPPWYSTEYFGKRVKVDEAQYENVAKSEQGRIKELGYVNDFGNSKLAEVYASLLGDSTSDGKNYRGAHPITSKKFPNLLGATIEILRRYRWAQRNDVVSAHINKYTKRDFVHLTEVFDFLGADLTASQKHASFQDIDNLIFKGTRFDGGFVNEASEISSRDAEIKALFGEPSLTRRRSPIIKYRNKLFRERGFRG